MRICKALLSSTISMAVTITLAPPAHAQSFIQKLFGFGGSHPAPAQSQPMMRQILPSHRFYGHNGMRRQTPRPERRLDDEDDIGPPDSGGPYRTLCVRTCDGYYFPLRHAARRTHFAPDVKSCRAACGDQGRLFYYSENGGGVETMLDLGGQKYNELPRAFAYRKALVKGCSCKPAPWSGEEAARHQGYAMAEAAQKAAEVSKAMAAEAEAAAAAKTQEKKPDAAVADAKPEAEPASKEPASAAEVVETPLPVMAKPPEAQVAEVVAEAYVPQETYVPVRPQVEKAIQRRRSARAKRERVIGASYKTTSSPGWFTPAKSGLIWPGDTR